MDFADMNLIDMGGGKIASFDGFCGTMPDTPPTQGMLDLDEALRAMNADG